MTSWPECGAAVLVETSYGEFTIDLFTKVAPRACENFLCVSQPLATTPHRKLCKIKYYNNQLFHNVQQGFLIQTGDPTSTGRGGKSIYGILKEGQDYFPDEIKPTLLHKRVGTVSMANAGTENTNGSQWFVTTGEDLRMLDGKHTIFGKVEEGIDVVLRINDAYCDPNDGRPYQNIRIKHTDILEDPFDDPAGLARLIPSRSPSPTPDQIKEDKLRLADNEDPFAVEYQTEAERVVAERAQEAKKAAVVLEMIGDIPEADARPDDNVLFVCKLNPVTGDDDLELIFSRFGDIASCEVVRDVKTGDSLQYAFIEFKDVRACEEAYFKMDNVLIDDRRIRVDFSQSTSRQRGGGRGIMGAWLSRRSSAGGRVDALQFKDQSRHGMSLVMEVEPRRRHRDKRRW